jgi:hypothetical protein
LCRKNEGFERTAGVERAPRTSLADEQSKGEVHPAIETE